MVRGVGLWVLVSALVLGGGEGVWGWVCFGGFEELPCVGDLGDSLETVLSGLGRPADDCLAGVC